MWQTGFQKTLTGSLAKSGPASPRHQTVGGVPAGPRSSRSRHGGEGPRRRGVEGSRGGRDPGGEGWRGAGEGGTQEERGGGEQGREGPRRRGVEGSWGGRDPGGEGWRGAGEGGTQEERGGGEQGCSGVSWSDAWPIGASHESFSSQQPHIKWVACSGLT